MNFLLNFEDNLRKFCFLKLQATIKMLSRRTLRYLQILNIGYWIFILPYRIAIENDVNSVAGKIIRRKGFHNILFRIHLTVLIIIHLIIAGFILSYDLWFAKDLLLQDRALGLSVASLACCVLVSGVVTLIKYEEICSLVKALLEFCTNAGER